MQGNQKKKISLGVPWGNDVGPEKVFWDRAAENEKIQGEAKPPKTLKEDTPPN